MKKLALLSFILWFICPSLAQSTLGRYCSDTIPPNFKLNASSLRNHIYDGISNSYKQGEYDRRTLHFAHSSSSSVSNLVSNGEVYSDWQELETYLNDILHKVVPPELKHDTVIHAYIIQDGDNNAFMMPSGHTFITIGKIAEATDEATIAGTICHELAHYYMKHALHRFHKKENGEFDRGVNFGNKAGSKYSIQNELQADSLAMVWLSASGYNIQGLISSFQSHYRGERNFLKQLRDDWELKEVTHPLSSKRLEKILAFCDKNKTNPGKDFMIDETKFKQFREQAKIEVLKVKLDNFEFQSCLETAFRYHLFDPDNSTYVYYLMEGIRRNCYLNVDIWSQKFITNHYYDSVMVDGRRHKEKMEDHLFKKFDLEIIPIDPKEGVKLKARFYWKGEPKFTTYEEAYNFFYKLGNALNCHECVLSNALSMTDNDTTRNKLLSQYLSYTDIRHKEYATHLLAGTINKKLGDKKLICFSRFHINVEQGYEKIPLYDMPGGKKSILSIIFDSTVMNHKNRIPLFLPDYKYHHLNDYRQLTALETFSFALTVSKGEKTEIHILNPDYWELFNRYNVNEIEFINCLYNEIYGMDKTTAGYKKFLDLDVRNVFSRPINTKSLNIYITSVRAMDNALMKIRYVGEEYALKGKDPIENQIIKAARYELSIKEVKAKKADGEYRHRYELKPTSK